MTRHTLAFAATILFLAVPRGAQADGSDAQRLFEEARTLVENGRWAEACPRLAESMRLEPNMTTQFRLADCYEKTGRTASAWTNYVEAAKAAAAAGQSAKETFAAERAAKLEPHVDRLLIIAKPSPELQIERDGHSVPQAAWNAPQPLDPGEHTVHAWAPGKSSFDVLVTVTGKGETRRVEIPDLEPALPWRLSSEAIPKPMNDQVPPRPPAADRPASSPWRTVGWALGGVGLAAAATGGALYVSEVSRTDPCAGSRCVPSVTLLGGGVLVVITGALAIALSSH